MIQNQNKMHKLSKVRNGCKYAVNNETFYATFPWQDFSPDTSLTFSEIPDISRQSSNSLTFPGFPDKWSPASQSVNLWAKLESSGGMTTALWKRSPATRSSLSKCACIAAISLSRSLITSCSDAISSSMSRSTDDMDEELVSHVFGSGPEISPAS